MSISLCEVLVTVLLFLPIVRCANTLAAIPAVKQEIDTWFNSYVGPLSARKAFLDPVLVAAEEHSTVVTVRTHGGGHFKTVMDAIKSIPEGNKNRVIISIGPGNYTEKISIDRYKPFITFYGDPKDMPVLVFDGTALEYGTIDSATVFVESDYFSAVNIKFVNSAPRPDGKRLGAQAAAMTIGGDKASFYNCRFHGFQDTLIDDRGRHFFKDCYVEGTTDFICGSGASIYLNSELHVIPGPRMAMITAHARKAWWERNGYMFVHCTVTGTGEVAVLGRPWFPYARVIFAYSELSDVVNPVGWFNGGVSANERTIYFGEYNNKGPGANLARRVGFTKKLTHAEANQFTNLEFLDSSKWLLPPTKI